VIVSPVEAGPILAGQDNTDSSDPFVFNFDENGNGSISINGGPFTAISGTLQPDPTNAGTRALTYLLPSSQTPVGNGDVLILESPGVLSDVIRFTDASGNLTGGTADRMIYYSDVDDLATEMGALADTGFPSNVDLSAISVDETGPEGANRFTYGFPDVYNGISDRAVPEPSSAIMLVSSMFPFALAFLRGRHWFHRHVSRLLLPVVFAVAATMLAPIAHAQHGREEGPIEIEKCQTIDKPGSYKLVKNLTLTIVGSGCLLIVADFVTVDLAGFTISGPGGGVAIEAQSPAMRRGIAVRNGAISGFPLGVLLDAADGAIVEGLRIFGSTNPADIPISGAGGPAGINAGNGLVRGNAIMLFAVGVIATGVVTGNYAAGNREGMRIGAGSTVIGNTALDNLQEGLVVSCPSNVTDNTATGNGLGNLMLKGEGCNDTNNVAP
jgi:hypothetical protein